MLDAARFYGIVLVYFGHIIEQVMYLDNVAAAAQYKFIYSFHMPFFFVLSGFVAKPERLRTPPGAFFKRFFASRLVPYGAFSLLLLFLSLFFKGWFPVVDLSTASGYLKGVVQTLQGLPAFNIPLWFLALLVTTELLHYAVGRFLNSGLRLLAAAVGFYLLGYLLNLEFTLLRLTDLFIGSVWYVNEAPVVYAFYLVGVYLRRRGFLLGPVGPARVWAGIGLSLAAVYLTFDLNQGPFVYLDAVVVLLSGHGNIWLFPFTALAGSLLLILLGKASGECRWVGYLGENTIILFCLNGVFYHFLNQPAAAWFVGHLPGSPLVVFAFGAAATFLSLLLCLPAVWLLRAYFPQLVGRPTVQGPLLPRLTS